MGSARAARLNRQDDPPPRRHPGEALDDAFARVHSRSDPCRRGRAPVRRFRGRHAGKGCAARQRGFAAADAAIIRNLPVDASVLAGAARPKVIAKHGAGYDNIDVAAATAQGIVVANVPGGNADAVAEATVALMLAALRRVP